MTVTIRLRSAVWFATGVALTLVVSLLITNAWRADAAPGDTDSTFVPITTCRLVDTRPPPLRVNTFTTWGASETKTVRARGANGNCAIPSQAVALSLNVTALNATADGFLTFWPAGALPFGASLNPSPGQPPIPNAVTVKLSTTGTFRAYNENGTVDMVIDVNGYYTKSSLEQLANRLTALEKKTAALDAAQPFTVVGTGSGGVSAGAAPTAIRKVTVKAPVDGKVVAIATGDMSESAAGQLVYCGLMDSVTDPPFGAGVFWQAPTDANTAHLAVSRVFDISAGSTATYTLVCRNYNGVSSFIGAPMLTAIFTPDP